MNIKLWITTMVGVLFGTMAMAQNSNVAYQDNEVRFTVIADGVVRMEYAPQGKFVDERSQVAVIRSYPKSNYKVKTGPTIQISTPRMVVKYKKGTGRFTDKNLVITSPKGVKPFRWVPGTKDSLNLKGTCRTLDGYDGDVYAYDGKQNKLNLEDGLLSRSGWTLIDDSRSYLFDNDPQWSWVKERPNRNEAQDLYFMAYGNDYKRALKDFTLFADKMPLPPRYAFGYWWSRYWGYSDTELRMLLDRMEGMDIPLDVLVIDMDWHYADNKRGGWTGYTWDTQLFPNPTKFLNYLRDERNLKVTLNLHPADGVRPFDTPYEAMARHMGVDAGEGKQIPFEASNKRFMTGLLDVVLRPMNDQGVSFWWLDWQQWRNDKRLADLSNTWWLNYAFFSHAEKFRQGRPMLYHRWGGLGNHRYQVGFSGDTYITWPSLKYQPLFNSTASNVLYGYWSHDIGGHQGARTIEPELYVRWFQFGALSPILRTHSSKQSGLNKEPWVFDYKVGDILRQTVQSRYAMAPYIYTMARTAYDEGISLCRPLYYGQPTEEKSYEYKHEYMFGDKMLVAPIGEAMKDGQSKLKVWLPDGCQWYEVATGTMLKGNQETERTFMLDEYPLYVAGGSIIPYYTNKVKNLQSNDEPITVTVYPGGDDAQFVLYEDAGDSKDYATQYATTELSQHRNANILKVTVGARQGSYEGMPTTRKYSVKVLCSALPEKVTLNGKEIPYRYDAKELALIADLPITAAGVSKEVEIVYPQNQMANDNSLADGTVGQMRRAYCALADYKHKNCLLTRTNPLSAMETIVEAVNYDPSQLRQKVDSFRAALRTLPQLLHDNRLSPADSTQFLRTMGM